MATVIPDSRLRPDAGDVARSDLARVRAYYDETWSDYRRIWLNAQNCAVHFGYWDTDTRGHAESLLHMNRVLARQLGLRTAQRILDAGCGVGGSAIWLAKTYGCEVVGITPVASQVLRARRFAGKHRVADHVQFEQQDYTATTYPAASFDVVWAIESACHARDKRRLLAEARRLLRPGGQLGIVEYMRVYRPLAPVDESLLRRWLAGWAIPDIATAEEWRRWTQAAGFSDPCLTDITARVRPSLHRLYLLASLAWPVASVVHSCGLRTETRHGNTRGARDQYLALQRGLWSERVLTATAV
ncbi:MAG TPA: methyltransferase domain-containing protein [Chloroflexota bacterium]|jgi:cyclopropane fatty-acyl-phospholipid synthase-like methyltransferase|nr:methyltransferase domain-containing protein [Chloroflexota bacterium]